MRSAASLLSLLPHVCCLHTPTLQTNHAPCSAASPQVLELWLERTYDAVNYESMFTTLYEGGDAFDDSSEEFNYGETSLNFLVDVLDRALSARAGSADGGGCSFLDLGGGKGQVALASAYAEPLRLDGKCVSLELLPELHAIGSAAAALAATELPALSRVAAVAGSFYDVDTLNTACGIGDVAVAFAYATKFASTDGVHAERLSAALAASELPASAVVATVNRRLCEDDGWVEAAPPLMGATPHEDDEPGQPTSGTAYFWRRVGSPSPPSSSAASTRSSAPHMQIGGAEDATSDVLEVALLTEERLLLDVYATWCGPCALLAPQMDTLARVLNGRVRVMKFDSEQTPGGAELATSLSVRGLPTLLFISEGDVLHRVEGALTADRIAELVEGVWFGAEMPRGQAYGDLGPEPPPAGTLFPE